ncbi:MAG: CdaR family protein [Pyrinomonadaceae bacterium]
MAVDSKHNQEKRPPGLFLKHIIRKIFLEDWMMKLVAVIITLALWFGVTGLSTPTTTRMSGIPLTLRFSSSTEITNSPIREVDIVISGDKRRIGQINKNDLGVFLDLTDTPPGDRVVNLNPETVAIELPTGIKLDGIEPNKIAVRLEAVEEKEVDVHVETEGELPEGYEIYGESVQPQRVRVRGPASFIRLLTSVSTEKINLTGRTSDFTSRQTSIDVSHPKATVLETVVDVLMRIGEKRVEKIFLVPVKDAHQRTATVVVYGAKSLFETVLPGDFVVEGASDVNGETTTRLTLPAALEGKVEIRSLRVK